MAASILVDIRSWGGGVLYSHSLTHVLLTEGMLLRCHHSIFCLHSDLCST